MAEPHWASYVGMATGIIGAVTGIAGAIVSIVSYRRSSRIKTLDMRLELRKNAADLREEHASLSDLIDRANNSRRAVAAASGRFHSGMMERWNEQITADRSIVSEMRELIPAADETFLTLDETTLEARLIEIHKLSRRVNDIKAKYDASLTEDDNERNHIREDHRVHQNSR